MKDESPAIQVFKDKALHLKSLLKHQAPDISHGECLNIIARLHGAKDWNTLIAGLKNMDKEVKK